MQNLEIIHEIPLDENFSGHDGILLDKRPEMNLYESYIISDSFINPIALQFKNREIGNYENIKLGVYNKMDILIRTLIFNTKEWITKYFIMPYGFTIRIIPNSIPNGGTGVIEFMKVINT